MQPEANPHSGGAVVGGDEGGRYELLGRLAVGGMAELYLARALDGLHRGEVVVLKRILPHLGEDPEFVRMFQDEAHLAATLDHPNIVHVYDIGRHGEDYFFTMEYVHGENLRAILREAQRKKGSIHLDHVLTIGDGVCAALHYAHERVDAQGNPLRIVHRDVSPTNVLVASDGSVKLVDFGIAKAAAGTHITQAGMLKGKASYMSPEQCRAEPVDRRSDVFALGILLYETTTLTRLFKGENELAILHQVLTTEIEPPSVRRPGYPPALERVVLKSLQRDPSARHQTALELRQDLQGVAHQLGLRPSNESLGRFMAELFGHKPLPWSRGDESPTTRASASQSRAHTAVEHVDFEGADDTDVTRHRDNTSPTSIPPRPVAKGPGFRVPPPPRPGRPAPQFRPRSGAKPPAPPPPSRASGAAPVPPTKNRPTSATGRSPARRPPTSARRASLPFAPPVPELEVDDSEVETELAEKKAASARASSPTLGERLPAPRPAAAHAPSTATLRGSGPPPGMLPYAPPHGASSPTARGGVTPARTGQTVAPGSAPPSSSPTLRGDDAPASSASAYDSVPRFDGDRPPSGVDRTQFAPSDGVPFTPPTPSYDGLRQDRVVHTQLAPEGEPRFFLPASTPSVTDETSGVETPVFSPALEDLQTELKTRRAEPLQESPPTPRAGSPVVRPTPFPGEPPAASPNIHANVLKWSEPPTPPGETRPMPPSSDADLLDLDVPPRRIGPVVVIIVSVVILVAAGGVALTLW